MTTEKPNAMVLRCEDCCDNGTYLPGAARLTLYTHGRMVLEFFCVHCRMLNRQQLRRAAFADALTEMGVPTTTVVVPAEVGEHPDPRTPAITGGHVMLLEKMSMAVFNRQMERELKFDGR